MFFSVRRALFSPRRVAFPVERLRELFLRCGLGSVVENNAVQFEDRAMLQAFAPLFTPHFTIENHHFTTLGDIVIDEFLSGEVLHYTMHTGLVLSMNACKQLNAVLHNHFTLRLFAKDLQFDELAVPLGVENLVYGRDSTSVEPNKTEEELEFLSPRHVGLRGRDTLGTSYHMTPLRCGQSQLGWIFSHFVGAVHHCLGQDAARALLLHMYGGGLDTALPNVSVSLLLRALRHFPPMNVAEAILASQGLQAQFIAKTKPLPVDQESNGVGDGAHGTAVGSSDGIGNVKGAYEEMSTEREAVVCSGFGVSSSMHDALTLDELVEKSTAKHIPSGERGIFSSLASGPRGVDAVEVWKQRVEREKQLLQTPGDTDCRSADCESGWLQADEWERWKRGAAFRNSVDFSAAANYFADAYGQKQPVDGQKISRLRFKTPVRDPAFYDAQSDMRNGVPFSADGEPVSSYVDGLIQPHARLFEVSLVVDGRVAGRAITWRYTSARESACKAFLGAVLHDLQVMRERSIRGDGSGARGDAFTNV